MINSIGHIVEQETNHDEVVNLYNIFDLKQNELEAEICLIQIQKEKNCDEWIKWFTNYDKQDLF